MEVVLDCVIYLGLLINPYGYLPSPFRLLCFEDSVATICAFSFGEKTCKQRDDADESLMARHCRVEEVFTHPGQQHEEAPFGFQTSLSLPAFACYESAKSSFACRLSEKITAEVVVSISESMSSSAMVATHRKNKNNDPIIDLRCMQTQL